MHHLVCLVRGKKGAAEIRIWVTAREQTGEFPEDRKETVRRNTYIRPPTPFDLEWCRKKAEEVVDNYPIVWRVPADEYFKLTKKLEREDR
jgi:hypothetical protein